MALQSLFSSPPPPSFFTLYKQKGTDAGIALLRSWIDEEIGNKRGFGERDGIVFEET